MTDTKVCAHHKPHSDLSYGAFFEDCEKRQQRGEEQTQCKECGRWFWPDQMGVKP